MSRPKRKAECCPDKWHFCKGLCRQCYHTRNRERLLAEAQDYYKSNSAAVIERTAAARWRREYGMTPEDVQAMLESQANKCAVCSSPLGGKNCHIDHCHETGFVRGLLCFNCNTGIGKLGDNLPGLLRAVQYLQRPLTGFKGA